MSFDADYTYALCALKSSFCDGVCNMICDILLSIFVIRGVQLANLTSVWFCKNCGYRFGFTKLTTVSVFFGSVFALSYLP